MHRQLPTTAQTIDREILTPLARAAIECSTLRLETWQITTLSVQGRRTVFRFAGTGYDGVTARPWSLILKEIKAPESADAPDTDEQSWCYWPRESLLYEAGVPQSLKSGSHHSGLRSPRCFGVMEPTPDLRWIWLEDLQDCYDGDWPLERYALAAYHLGIFNGRYLTGKSMPIASWLTDKGLRSEAVNKAALERLRDPEIWAHTLLRSAFPTPVLPELERLVADRERILAGAAELPRTFCHLDAHSENMAAIKEATHGNESGAEGNSTEDHCTKDHDTEITVLFDWALSGYGAPGEEISRLVWAALLDFKVDIAEAERLEEMVFAGYIQGLTDAGWQADPAQVRYAYLMSSVFIFTLDMEAVDHAFDKDVEGLEKYYGWSQARMVEQSAQVTYLLLERADELRAMLDT